MSAKFTPKTFKYLDEAYKNKKKLAWFEKNEELYQESVKEPFGILLRRIDLEIGEMFPGLPFNPKKLSQPTYRKNNIPSDGTVVKPNAWAFVSEKESSMYEWNPGIYLSLSKDENVMGVGLYMMSSRQIKLLRRAIINHPEKARAIIEDKKFKKVWGGLQGERYVRFPKEYDPEAPGAEYLWHKQFYVSQTLTRKDVTSAKFADKVVNDLKVAAPFLNWIREVVGKYQASPRILLDD